MQVVYLDGDIVASVMEVLGFTTEELIERYPGAIITDFVFVEDYDLYEYNSGTETFSLITGWEVIKADREATDFEKFKQSTIRDNNVGPLAVISTGYSQTQKDDDINNDKTMRDFITTNGEGTLDSIFTDIADSSNEIINNGSTFEIEILKFNTNVYLQFGKERTVRYSYGKILETLLNQNWVENIKVTYEDVQQVFADNVNAATTPEELELVPDPIYPENYSPSGNSVQDEEARNILIDEIFTQCPIPKADLSNDDLSVVNVFIKEGTKGFVYGTYGDVTVGREIYNTLPSVTTPADTSTILNGHISQDTIFDTDTDEFVAP